MLDRRYCRKKNTGIFKCWRMFNYNYVVKPTSELDSYEHNNNDVAPAQFKNGCTIRGIVKMWFMSR